MSVSGRRQTGEDVGQQSPERPPSLLAVALRMVDDVDDARDLLWDSLLPALRATRLHADPFHVPYPGAGGGPAPSVSTGFRSAIESPSAGRTWWQFWWQYVGALAGIPGHAHRKQVPEIPETVHVLLALRNGFPSWPSSVHQRRANLEAGDLNDRVRLRARKTLDFMSRQPRKSCYRSCYHAQPSSR